MRPRIIRLALILLIVTFCLIPANVSTFAQQSTSSLVSGALDLILEGVPAILPAGATPAAGPHIIPIGAALL